MKHLTITYDGTVLFDAEVATFDWSDSEAGISVKARTQSRSNGSGLDGLLERLRTARPPVNQASDNGHEVTG